MIKILIFKCVKIWKVWKDYISDKVEEVFCYMCDLKELMDYGVIVILLYI